MLEVDRHGNRTQGSPRAAGKSRPGGPPPTQRPARAADAPSLHIADPSRHAGRVRQAPQGPRIQIVRTPSVARRARASTKAGPDGAWTRKSTGRTTTGSLNARLLITGLESSAAGSGALGASRSTTTGAPPPCTTRQHGAHGPDPSNASPTCPRRSRQRSPDPSRGSSPDSSTGPPEAGAPCESPWQHDGTPSRAASSASGFKGPDISDIHGHAPSPAVIGHAGLTRTIARPITCWSTSRTTSQRWTGPRFIRAAKGLWVTGSSEFAPTDPCLHGIPLSIPTLFPPAKPPPSEKRQKAI